MLDDHLLKAQTMRGSPFVKAFEGEMIAWEEKLISMQDILEQWLMVRFKNIYYLQSSINFPRIPRYQNLTLTKPSNEHFCECRRRYNICRNKLNVNQ